MSKGNNLIDVRARFYIMLFYFGSFTTHMFNIIVLIYIQISAVYENIYLYTSLPALTSLLKDKKRE